MYRSDGRLLGIVIDLSSGQPKRSGRNASALSIGASCNATSMSFVQPMTWVLRPSVSWLRVPPGGKVEKGPVVADWGAAMRKLLGVP